MRQLVIILTLVSLPIILTACGSTVSNTSNVKPTQAQKVSKTPINIGKPKTNQYAMCYANKFMSYTFACINVNRTSNTEVCSGKSNEFCGKNIGELCAQVGQKINKSNKPFRDYDEVFSSKEDCEVECKSNPFENCAGVVSDN